MSKKFNLILAVVMTLAIFLAACERSASQAPLPTPTPTGNTTAPQTDPMRMLQALATQTAMAAAGLPTPDLTGTPETAGTETTPDAGSPTPTSLLPPTGAPGATSIPATQIAVTTTPPARPATYTLQKGEFPYCIARRYNVDPAALMALNGLTEGHTYRPGLLLNIPQTAGPFPPPRALRSHPATYNVTSADDTIYKIACYYGDVDPLVIAAVNNLVSPYTLHAGQTLNIP
ncbi:MAG: LysM peptidoglycan-binding domain-containing protein [Anaerolineales bacterium]|nr:LysM peptidoglycan-binding domain-containing protein [Anaerolineales bacterium]